MHTPRLMTARRGNGEPVLLPPGLGRDVSMSALRGHLTTLGAPGCRVGLGTNDGDRDPHDLSFAEVERVKPCAL